MRPHDPNHPWFRYQNQEEVPEIELEKIQTTAEQRAYARQRLARIDRLRAEQRKNRSRKVKQA